MLFVHIYLHDKAMGYAHIDSFNDNDIPPFYNYLTPFHHECTSLISRLCTQPNQSITFVFIICLLKTQSKIIEGSKQDKTGKACAVQYEKHNKPMQN